MHKNGLGSTKLLKKQDAVLILVFLFLALAAFLWMKAGQKEGRQLQISVDGAVTAVYPLSGERSISIDGVGGTNRCIIENGSVNMLEADCPDKICVSHKKIHLVGETIVCLPHKVVLEIVDGAESGTSPEKKYDILVQ